MARGLTGVDGAVRIASTLVGKIRRWRLTTERNVVDTGGFGDEWEEPDGTRLRATGSFEGVYAIEGESGQGQVKTALIANALVVLDLQQKTGYVTQINARITQVEEGTDFDGASTFSAQFAQVGAPIAEAGHA